MTCIIYYDCCRYVEAWINGEKYMKAKREGDKGRMYMYFLFMYVEKRTATLNSLIESFLESAPQLILQLYIVAAGTNQSQYDFWRGCIVLQFHTGSFAHLPHLYRGKPGFFHSHISVQLVLGSNEVHATPSVGGRKQSRRGTV